MQPELHHNARTGISAIILDLVTDRDKHLCPSCHGEQTEYIVRPAMEHGVNAYQVGPDRQACGRCGGRGWIPKGQSQ